MDFFDIQEELKKLPDSPGVYLMHNEQDEIIYVGKAISLKNRVRQYFQSSRNKSPKILRMVSNIRWFEYILTDSELEALVLENNLIKEHQPRYNTMLKDGKTYPYIKVTIHEPYPRILFSRERKKDHARYFGPYTSSESVKNTIDLLHKLFKIRTCHRTAPLSELPSRTVQCPLSGNSFPGRIPGADRSGAGFSGGTQLQTGGADSDRTDADSCGKYGFRTGRSDT